MFRAAIREGTALGKRAERFMNEGSLVPDDVVIGMVLERIQQSDCVEGFMLDGFPRTVPQARALQETLESNDLNLDAVVLIEVPDTLVVERITGRRTDPETGATYHLVFNPPPPEVAQRCTQRSDDTPDKCRARLEKYHSETAPIIPVYEAQGILRRVDGVGGLEEVTARMVAALDA
jgi:adenylate kinase